jgi:Resolvase, N terminal domain
VRVGYARVSRQDQRLEPQRDALLTDGCERVFEEKVSSREAERKALHEAFDYCREGDVLVVARLDRLGRSVRELIDLVRELENRGVGGEAEFSRPGLLLPYSTERVESDFCALHPDRVPSEVPQSFPGFQWEVRS